MPMSTGDIPSCWPRWPRPTSRSSTSSCSCSQHEHINFYGTYSFDLETELSREGHRPLHSPAARERRTSPSEEGTRLAPLLRGPRVEAIVSLTQSGWGRARRLCQLAVDRPLMNT